MIVITKISLRSIGVLIAFWVLSGPAMALDVAVPYVGADYIWSQGYTGAGVEIGIIDLFVADSNHPAIDGNFLGNQNFAKGATFMGSHATLVTGAAVSQDPTYTGVAPDAGWWSGQTTNAGTITKERFQTVAVETFAHGLGGLLGNPVEVISLSIGLPGDTSAVDPDQWSLGIDHVIRDSGRTMTIAAGNGGPSNGTLAGRPTGAYNAIIGGGTGADINGDPSEDYSNFPNYTSRGPTDDGRSKPDIIAPASWMHVPILNSAWDDFNGTSISTPIVAGGAALLIDMGLDLGHSTDSKVIKSVLLNSADKLSNWSHTSTQPLDIAQGAGQMNLENAYHQYLPAEQDPGTVSDVGWDIQQINHNSENLYTINGIVLAGEFITATLAWDRIVTTGTEEDIDDVVYSFDHLDNLDLYLYDADDLSTPLASSISTIDNVEHLYYSAATTGNYVLGVKMANAPVGSELYALAWSTLAEILDLLPGDANNDGVVSADDYGSVQLNFGDTGDINIPGDANLDGVVSADDYGSVQLYFGATAGMGSVPVPEPTTLGLLLLGGLAMLKRRRS